MRLLIVSHFMTDHRTPSWISSIWWVASTIVGGLVFYLVAFQAIIVLRIPVDDGPPSSLNAIFTMIGAIGGATAGVGVGLAQWFTLRKSVPWGVVGSRLQY